MGASGGFGGETSASLMGGGKEGAPGKGKVTIVSSIPKICQASVYRNCQITA